MTYQLNENVHSVPVEKSGGNLEGHCQCGENPSQHTFFPSSWLVKTVPKKQEQDTCPPPQGTEPIGKACLTYLSTNSTVFSGQSFYMEHEVLYINGTNCPSD